MNLVRLNKYIASTQGCSRREADAIIEHGSVTINGEPAEMGMKIDADDKDIVVSIDHQPIAQKAKQITYVMLNKPKGFIVTRNDEHADRTVMELLPSSLQHVHPVGRLDKQSEGLLLLTNDGDLTYQLTHPKFEKDKEYIVTVRTNLREADIHKLRTGVVLMEGNTGSCEVEQLSSHSFRIVLKQGWNRQIRRMVEQIDNTVKHLQRVRIGSLQLGKLPIGKWRIIQKTDII